ncbi:MAG: hypothetical protein IIA41_12355 [SAR324 cluster bacterium]|nr:hypothetical protein [SAR324 cluster bacterium]
MRANILWIAVALALAGCDALTGDSGGSSKGKTYGTLDASSDILAADFTAIGFPSPFTTNTVYQLKKGTGTVLWESDWLGCCIIYSLTLTIEGGTSDSDRLYSALISGDTLFYSDTLVDKGTFSLAAPADGVELPSLQDGSNAQPGRFEILED